MLEDHERAAMLPNEENVTWHQFVRARFIGDRNTKSEETSLSVDIQTVSQESPSHAEIQGLLEYSSGLALPIVVEFVGTLLLDSREVIINDMRGIDGDRNYLGSLCENGRVLTLRAVIAGKPRPNRIHLVHEGTLTELLGN